MSHSSKSNKTSIHYWSHIYILGYTYTITCIFLYMNECIYIYTPYIYTIHIIPYIYIYIDIYIHIYNIYIHYMYSDEYTNAHTYI